MRTNANAYDRIRKLPIEVNRIDMKRIEEIKRLGRSEDSNEVRVCVSMFSGYNNPIPTGEIPLADFLLQPTYKKEVEVLRGCGDKARLRELKSKLPAITPSGIFSRRRNDGLIRHSGFICIDIDGQDNHDVTDWEALKSSLSDFTGLWYTGLSASGNGLFLIFRIKYPEMHANHFTAISSEFGESERGWFHTISRQSTKYNSAECDRQYTRCLRTCDHTSIATLFMICKRNGITTTLHQRL